MTQIIHHEESADDSIYTVFQAYHSCSFGDRHCFASSNDRCNPTRVQSNPRLGGIYLFGVIIYPARENGLGQFLGYGRISLDSNSN
ncbi:MAG: DUF2808 domain-containing protein [Oscillatoriophycideae cyanobacterium NC_groundwater_1537_Pr4_S-0.65um_50_18]|nr:DUF2808 domain-containing protein [Oscillatoriophycideae cyanobacterium NC_groundwater_1537_Pr4_S-0.65um_50_18]